MRAAVIALALSLMPGQATAADQFDLLCVSTKGEKLHYRVDLAAREWCWEECKFGTWRIADVTSSRIVFKDEATARSIVSNVVDRASGTFSRYNRDLSGTSASSGKCEPAPFSGFPKAKF